MRVKRELEGGWFQWIVMPMPALLTIQSGINQLRYATLKGIMAAKKKEIRKCAALASGAVSSARKIYIAALHVPEKTKKTRMMSTGRPPTRPRSSSGCCGTRRVSSRPSHDLIIAVQRTER